MEVRIANRVPGIKETLKEQLSKLPEGKEILIFFNRSENGEHLKYKSTWHKLVKRELPHRQPRMKTEKHQLGITLRLWHEKPVAIAQLKMGRN